MMKIGISLCIILSGFSCVTAQSAKIDTEKLLEYYETQRYADAANYLQNIYPGETQDIKAFHK